MYPQSNDRSLRGLIETILLSPTPDLTRDRLSPDLLMWNRLHGEDDLPPRAYDMTDDFLDYFGWPSAETEDLKYRDGSQECWYSWLAREPLDIGYNDEQHLARSEVAAHLIFARLRPQALEKAKQGEDPLDMQNFRLVCWNKFHGEGKVLVIFPEVEWNDEDQKRIGDMIQYEPCNPRLMMLVLRASDGSYKLDNLFVAYDRDAGWNSHPWTKACVEDGETDGPEYIADPNEFWDGYSDDEQVPVAEVRDVEVLDVATPSPPPPARGRRQSGRAATRQVKQETPPPQSLSSAQSEQDAPIRDIVRGAFALHRSQQPASSNLDATEAFVQLVRTTIASPP